ncbi:hypothetical protein M0R45_006892 [Rubus argutus]|uniref:Uncharacterized protein n=1 Tax=Rubus argutus TaxID=59490 RepID=A0AAW1YRW3_RUBAR
MEARKLEKMASIDAQLRLLAPGKVSEDDKLIEYDALLLIDSLIFFKIYTGRISDKPFMIVMSFSGIRREERP